MFLSRVAKARNAGAWVRLSLLGILSLCGACRFVPENEEWADPAPYHESDQRPEPIAASLAVRVPEQALADDVELPKLPGVAEDRLRVIINTRDFVALDELERRYLAQGDVSEKADLAFDMAWALLTAGIEPPELIESLDLLCVHTEVTGAREYTFYLLFRPTTDLDVDHHFVLDGYVFPQNMDLLDADDQKRGFPKFHRVMRDNPTSSWQKGRHYVVPVPGNAPLIPYSLALRIYSPTEEVFWAAVGNQLQLGWQWAYQDEQRFIQAVRACETPADLYAIAPPGPRLTEPVAKALDAQWARLAEGLEPKALLDSLEVLDVDTQATGDREYTFSFLLRATAEVGWDYHLGVMGGVDRSHRRLVETVTPRADYTKWNINLSRDPTSLWAPGDYHVAQLRVETEPIPYEISLFLRAPGKDVYNPGNRVELGWQAAIHDSF